MNVGSACHVCGGAAGEADSVLCNNCDRRFHLRLQNVADGPECGEVWINEQYLSLEFACAACLGTAPGGDEPPIGAGH